MADVVGSKDNEMRRATFIIAFLLIFPSITRADCTIYLENGRVIRAGNCWDEGDTIKIEKYGGYVSVHKRDVDKIDNEEQSYSKGSQLNNQNQKATHGTELFTLNIEKKSWYKDIPVLQKETTIHPQIKFNIKNISEKSISPKIKFIFYQVGTRKRFDDATEYINELMPGDTSESHFARPSMGYIYNGFNLATILNTRFDVKIFYRINFSEWKFLKEIYFSTKRFE